MGRRASPSCESDFQEDAWQERSQGHGRNRRRPARAEGHRHGSGHQDAGSRHRPVHHDAGRPRARRPPRARRSTGWRTSTRRRWSDARTPQSQRGITAAVLAARPQGLRQEVRHAAQPRPRARRSGSRPSTPTASRSRSPARSASTNADGDRRDRGSPHHRLGVPAGRGRRGPRSTCSACSATTTPRSSALPGASPAPRSRSSSTAVATRRWSRRRSWSSTATSWSGASFWGARDFATVNVNEPKPFGSAGGLFEFITANRFDANGAITADFIDDKLRDGLRARLDGQGRRTPTRSSGWRSRR